MDPCDTLLQFSGYLVDPNAKCVSLDHVLSFFCRDSGMSKGPFCSATNIGFIKMVRPRVLGSSCLAPLCSLAGVVVVQGRPYTKQYTRLQTVRGTGDLLGWPKSSGVLSCWMWRPFGVKRK